MASNVHDDSCRAKVCQNYLYDKQSEHETAQAMIAWLVQVLDVILLQLLGLKAKKEVPAILIVADEEVVIVLRHRVLSHQRQLRLFLVLCLTERRLIISLRHRTCSAFSFYVHFRRFQLIFLLSWVAGLIWFVLWGIGAILVLVFPLSCSLSFQIEQFVLILVRRRDRRHRFVLSPQFRFLILLKYGRLALAVLLLHVKALLNTVWLLHDHLWLYLYALLLHHWRLRPEF